MSMEKSFASLSYRGTFRDYQRHLLKNLEDRLDERKLNIVTPPGSGKIVLGLELVRRIGEPCLVISSTEVMRNHWVENFVSSFLPDELQRERDAWVSYDLMKPAMLTSVTYEMLHAAFKKETVRDGGAETSFADVDIIRLVQDCGIRTALLDEPHHLDGRLMDSLESFLGVLGGEFRIVSMSSHPPYDLHSDEWDRYEALCGEISEEIHIPELVKGRALCPHEDFVYFNYPTDEESEGILGYRTRVDQAVAEAVALPFMGELNRRISRLYNRKKTDFLYSHHEPLVNTLEMLHEYGYRIDIGVYAHLTGHKTFAPLTADSAQRAINFLMESQTLLRDGEKEQLSEVFTRHRVMEHDRVMLSLTPKVRRTLVASMGKLESIATVTEVEDRSMGEALRQVVLTDPAKPTDLNLLGKGGAMIHVGPVSVFETLTRKLPHIPVACLTDDRAVFPQAAVKLLPSALGLSQKEMTTEAIGATSYTRCAFDSTQRMMEAAEYLFRKGHIRVLIGSADILGGGWDDSFVNTLIMASFNSSFVEINRMRGRVIHADKGNSKKAAHIWHLVTVERSYSREEHPELRLASRLTEEADGGLAVDYRHLARHFECYMGINQETGELENGIDRLGLKNGVQVDSIDPVNRAMLERAKKRSSLNDAWNMAMEDTTRPISEVRVPKAAKVPVFTPGNTILLLASIFGLIFGLDTAWFLGMTLIVYIFFNTGTIVSVAVVVVIMMFVMTLIMIALSVLFILYFLPLPIHHLTASMSIRSLCRNLLRTLKDIGEVSKDAVMVMETMPDKSGYRLYLDNCTHDEQIAFQKAVAEMFSAIRTPRYILVRGSWFRRLLWRWSFSCPSSIAKSDVWVKVFEKYVRRSMGSMKFQYTRRDPGRKYLIFARNKSYLNHRNKPCERRIHLLKNERIL